MHARLGTWLSGLLCVTLLVGCGDPGDEPDQEALERDEPISGQIYIEFTDARGEPLPAERVEVSVDGAPAEEATCMDDGCGVWVGEFEAMGRVTAWATSCGHRFGATVPLGPDLDPASPLETGVTIVGVTGLCPMPPTP